MWDVYFLFQVLDFIFQLSVCALSKELVEFEPFLLVTLSYVILVTPQSKKLYMVFLFFYLLSTCMKKNTQICARIAFSQRPSLRHEQVAHFCVCVCV